MFGVCNLFMEKGRPPRCLPKSSEETPGSGHSLIFLVPALKMLTVLIWLFQLQGPCHSGPPLNELLEQIPKSHGVVICMDLLP